MFSVEEKKEQKEFTIYYGVDDKKQLREFVTKYSPSSNSQKCSSSVSSEFGILDSLFIIILILFILKFYFKMF